MPKKFTDHHSSTTTKLLGMAQSGTGKTGSLAALANAGYKLYILDFDNGLDILRTYVRPDAQANIEYETLQDEYTSKTIKSTHVSGSAMAGETFAPKGTPQAFARSVKLLQKWPEVGSLADAGPEAIVVVDSATMMGLAALAYTMHLNNHVMPTQYDWGEAMDRQEGMIRKLTSVAFNTNVIVFSHIIYSVSDEIVGEETEVGYPSFLGKKLPPRVPSWFNTVITYKSKSNTGTREIHTDKVSKLNLKTSNPKSVKTKYSLDLDSDGYATGGLAALFEDIRKA